MLEYLCIYNCIFAGREETVPIEVGIRPIQSRVKNGTVGSKAVAEHVLCALCFLAGGVFYLKQYIYIIHKKEKSMKHRLNLNLTLKQKKHEWEQKKSRKKTAITLNLNIQEVEPHTLKNRICCDSCDYSFVLNCIAVGKEKINSFNTQAEKESYLQCLLNRHNAHKDTSDLKHAADYLKEFLGLYSLIVLGASIDGTTLNFFRIVQNASLSDAVPAFSIFVAYLLVSRARKYIESKPDSFKIIYDNLYKYVHDPKDTSSNL